MERLRIPNEFVPPRYKKLLMNLSERSHFQKSTRHYKRNWLKIKQEARERDFCLYFNLPQATANRRVAPLPTRSSSAPGYTTRKPWNVGSRCHLRTESGDIITLARNDYYSDDFEIDDEEEVDDDDSSDTKMASDSKDTFIKNYNFEDDTNQNYQYTDAEEDILFINEKTGKKSCRVFKNSFLKRNNAEWEISDKYSLSTLAMDSFECRDDENERQTDADESSQFLIDSLECLDNLMPCRRAELSQEYIEMEITSNWGSEESVGLSEIQLFIEGSGIPLGRFQVFSVSNSADRLIEEVAYSIEGSGLFHVQRACIPISVRLFFLGKLDEGRWLLKLRNCASDFGIKTCEMKLVDPLQEVKIFTGDLKQCQRGHEFESICFSIEISDDGRFTSCPSDAYEHFPNLVVSEENICEEVQENQNEEKDELIACLDVSRECCIDRLNVQAFDNCMEDFSEAFHNNQNGNYFSPDDSLSSSLDIFNQFQKCRLSNHLNESFIEDIHENITDDIDEEIELASSFMIPELPSGRELLIDILSTWGDKHFVGMTGLQIFNSEGFDITTFCSIATTSHLEEPFKIENLLDGINETRDAMHMWLTRFTPGKRHWLNLQLPSKTQIALLRIWNYNESRVHCSRGVRDVVFFLDDACIFRGEISKARGCENGPSVEFGETILFTTDEEILHLVAQHDFVYLRNSKKAAVLGDTTYDQCLLPIVSNSDGVSTRWFDLEIITIWCDREDGCRVGLTGVKAYGDKAGDLELSISHVQVINRLDISCQKLINFRNYTTEKKDMWYTDFDEQRGLTLRFWLAPVGRFGSTPSVFGIRLWNYNDHLQDNCFGVKQFRILDDKGRCISANDQPIVLRCAPGHLKYDFSQRFLFRDLFNDHQPTTASGFVLEVSLLSNWGNPDYIGLDKLEVIDVHGDTLQLDSRQICVYPGVTSELDLMSPEGAIWNPLRLIRESSQGSWISPITPNIPCQLYIIYDQPMKLSGIRLWNFSESDSSIGVCNFSVRLDDEEMVVDVLLKAKSICQTFLFS